MTYERLIHRRIPCSTGNTADAVAPEIDRNIRLAQSVGHEFQANRRSVHRARRQATTRAPTQPSMKVMDGANTYVEEPSTQSIRVEEMCSVIKRVTIPFLETEDHHPRP